MRWLHIVSALFRDEGPSGIVINTGPFEHIGFAIFAIEAAGALVRGVLLRRLIIQAALRARKHDRGLCYGGHPAIMRRWMAGSIRYCTGLRRDPDAERMAAAGAPDRICRPARRAHL